MAGKALEGGRKKSVDRTGYFFVAPFVIVFFIFNVYPVVRTFYLSFTDYKASVMRCLRAAPIICAFFRINFSGRRWATPRESGASISCSSWAWRWRLQSRSAILNIRSGPGGLPCIILPSESDCGHIGCVSVQDTLRLALRHFKSASRRSGDYRRSDKLAGLHGHGALRALSDRRLDVVRQFLHYADGGSAGNLQGLL